MAQDLSQPEAHPFSTLWQQYKLPIIFGSVSTLFIALSIILFIKSYQANVPIQFSTASPSGEVEGTSLAKSLLTVDVEGAVFHPGLYNLPAGSRVGDVIAAAGGITEEGDNDKIAQTINLAAKLIDGAKVYIPTKTDSSISSEASRDTGSANAIGISINTASVAQLDSLPGIGPVMAKKIIDNRPYQTLEELLNKKILSPSLYGKLKDQITL